MADYCYDIGRLTEFLDHFARSSWGAITDHFALVKGGAFHLAKTLAERFKSFGREIIQGDHVSEISHKNGKVMGIRLKGGYSIEAGN